MASFRTPPADPPAATTSPWCAPSASSIHQQGLFATKFIPADTLLIEYVGERISKEEADRRGHQLMDESAGTGDASVFIFILDDLWDIDGNFPHNTARLINHSCAPNAEAQVIGDEIWIVALRDIESGEEITFDYGFDLDHYEEHPCRCGQPNCIGYIVSKEYWSRLRRLLKKKTDKEAKRAADRQAREKRRLLRTATPEEAVD